MDLLDFKKNNKDWKLRESILNKLRRESLLKSINDAIQNNEHGSLENCLLRSPLLDQNVLDRALRCSIFFNNFQAFKLLLQHGANIMGEHNDNEPFFCNIRSSLHKTNFDLFLDYFFKASPIYLLMYEHLENNKIINYTAYLHLNEAEFDKFRTQAKKFFEDSIDDIYNIPEPTLTLFRLFFK